MENFINILQAAINNCTYLFFPKKLQTQNCKHRKPLKKSLVQKDACKLLVKLTPVVNFINIL